MGIQLKKAILLGATGLVGSVLTRRLLEDQRYGEIRVFTRRPLGFIHPKLFETQTDLLSLADQKKLFEADEVYCCVGTTRAKTPGKESYRAIDYGIPVSAARLCRQNNIPSLLVVSALGANAQSRIFYNRIKGEMEADVLKTGVPRTYLLQPSIIGGQRKEKRQGEWVAKKVMGLLDKLMIGPLKRYRVIAPECIAEAMLWLGNTPYPESRVPSEQIRFLASKERRRLIIKDKNQ